MSSDQDTLEVDGYFGVSPPFDTPIASNLYTSWEAGTYRFTYDEDGLACVTFEFDYPNLDLANLWTPDEDIVVGIEWGPNKEEVATSVYGTVLAGYQYTEIEVEPGAEMVDTCLPKKRLGEVMQFVVEEGEPTVRPEG